MGEGVKPKKKHKILNFIAAVIKCIMWAVFIILIVVACFLVYYVMLSKKASSQGLQYKPPMALYTIISPSMEPNIKVYDVVLSLKTDPKDLKEKDIITFYTSDENLNGIIVTHRIKKVHKTNNGYKFTTKGDNNVEPDAALVEEKNVIGEIKLKIPQLGRIQFFLSSKGGWFIAILIPALGVISYDIMKLVKLIALKGKVKKNKQEKLDVKENKDLNTETQPAQKPVTPIQSYTEVKKEEKTVVAPVPPIRTEENILKKPENNSPLPETKPVIPPKPSIDEKPKEEITKPPVQEKPVVEPKVIERPVVPDPEPLMPGIASIEDAESNNNENIDKKDTL